MTIYLNIECLASLVRKKRGSRGLREVTAEIANTGGSVSPSTLLRVESGRMPDMETFLALCNWLEVPPARLFRTTEEISIDTPESIAILLQSDKNLEPAIANALALLVKAAYRDLCQGDYV
ncbi:helix-turn-helix domain-containing protein [Nostoc sp.]|uniref:helix-turn-helix domain-containing protein n=1 Tax=Nostoc sp. TaxID=1180 RepID=UPI002FFCDF99